MTPTGVLALNTHGLVMPRSIYIWTSEYIGNDREYNQSKIPYNGMGLSAKNTITLTASEMSICKFVVPCFLSVCRPYALYILGPRSGGLNALGTRSAWVFITIKASHEVLFVVVAEWNKSTLNFGVSILALNFKRHLKTATRASR